MDIICHDFKKKSRQIGCTLYKLTIRLLGGKPL
jgi:hypothetical protein